MDRKLQRHRADSLRQHGFLVTTTAAGNKFSVATPCYALDSRRLSKDRQSHPNLIPTSEDESRSSRSVFFKFQFLILGISTIENNKIILNSYRSLPT